MLLLLKKPFNWFLQKYSIRLYKKINLEIKQLTLQLLLRNLRLFQIENRYTSFSLLYYDLSYYSIGLFGV